MRKSNDSKKQLFASDKGFWFYQPLKDIITTAFQRTSGRSLTLMASNAYRINLPCFGYDCLVTIRVLKTCEASNSKMDFSVVYSKIQTQKSHNREAHCITIMIVTIMRHLVTPLQKNENKTKGTKYFDVS